MKKILTFLMLLACAAGQMKADTVIFSADVTTTSTVSFEASSTTEITSDYAAIIGGTMYAINQQTSDKELIKSNAGAVGFSFTNNNTFFKIELDNPLQAGDVIAARGVSRTDTEIGLWVSTDDARPGSCNAVVGIQQASSAGWVDFDSYTIAAEDDLVGATTIYLYRSVGKTVYFDEFSITRSGTAATLSFPKTEYSADISAGVNSFTAPILTVDPAAAASEVTYSSSNTKVATVDASSGAITLVGGGKTTITAAISNSTTYSDASASYLLTVTDPAGVDVSGSITWELSSADNTNGVASEDLADYVKNINFSLGSALSFNGTQTLNGDKNGLKSTKIKMNDGGSATDDTHKILFAFKPNAGLTFHPTNVTFTATRCGTNGGKMEIDWVGAAAGDIHLKSTAASETSNDPARDNNDTQNYTVYSLDIDPEAGAATGDCGLQIILYNANGKSYAFRDIIITGSIDGVEQAVTSYVITAASADETMGTVSPESVEVDEGESVTLTATPKTGYMFVSWTRGSDNATLTDNPLTVDNVTAAENYTASFKKLFKVEYSAGEGDMGTVTTVLNPEYAESTYTLPAANYYISKDGYTATGWTDGANEYDFAETITLTEDITLTPVFEANVTSLDEADGEVTVTWDFTGTPVLNIEGATGYFVVQAEVNSVTLDIPMFIDNTTGSAIDGVRGKTYNIGRNNAQINKGSKFTIPAEKGMKVVITSVSGNITETTVAGQTPSSGSGTKVATYVYEGTDATVDIVFSDDGKYYSTIEVTYPEQAQPYVLQIGQTGYASYYNSQSAFIIPEGLTASVVESVSDMTIDLVELEGIIPAGCGVVLEGTPNETYVFVPTKEPGVVGENMLRGSDDYAYTVGDDSEADYKFYALSQKNGKVGFYWMANNGGRFQNEPFKAYLPIKQTSLTTTSANALFFDITDGLKNVVIEGENVAQPSYNLAGQKVNDSYKGVVIANGKKVVR